MSLGHIIPDLNLFFCRSMIVSSAFSLARYGIYRRIPYHLGRYNMSTGGVGYLQDPANGTVPNRVPVTVTTLHRMKADGVPIASLTAYDYTMAAQMERAGIDLVLVGDSLGSVVQGHASTLPVSLADVLYHTRCVRRTLHAPLLVADLPFECMRSLQAVVDASVRLVAEGGAAMVKLEAGGAGAALHLEMIQALTQRAVPVCAHLGLRPQAVHALGGYRVQGKQASARSAAQLMQDACAAEEAGAQLIVLECVPETLARDITQRVRVPTIGIGAGVHCDGQVLVLYDALGLCAREGVPAPKFVKNFLQGRDSVQAALHAYVTEVKARRFPAKEHTYH